MHNFDQSKMSDKKLNIGATEFVFVPRGKPVVATQPVVEKKEEKKEEPESKKIQ
jgi:hypothetical protein